MAMDHVACNICVYASHVSTDHMGRLVVPFSPPFTDGGWVVRAFVCMLFGVLAGRLWLVGSHYGALPAHDGLWQAATETAEDALARLAIVPMVLEARALDITPATVERFDQAGDEPTVKILRRILVDEIRHVQAGTKWFVTEANRRNLNPPIHYQMLVKRHFRGSVKPPFNDSARRQAGLTHEFYAALAT